MAPTRRYREPTLKPNVGNWARRASAMQLAVSVDAVSMKLEWPVSSVKLTFRYMPNLAVGRTQHRSRFLDLAT